MDFKNTLSFLSKLKKNNHKEWFDKNKDSFLTVKEEFEIFVGKLIKEMAQTDLSLQTLEAKQCLFRIYKDVRFSKDKTPYKTHLGAYIAPGGRKSEYAGYYLHIEPGNSFLAGGIWRPESEILQAIRQEIDYNIKDFLTIINNTVFKKYFKEIQGEKLIRHPKEYTPDHPYIEYLKFKSFNTVYELDDVTVVATDFFKKSMAIYKAMKPLNDFLNVAVSEARNKE